MRQDITGVVAKLSLICLKSSRSKMITAKFRLKRTASSKICSSRSMK
ncbi:MAG: hypothetical protein R2856_07205 [Caldilineaceae bacterium]